MLLSDTWKDEVKELSGGGVDMVLDPVGGDRFTDSLRSLRENGRVVVVGFTGGSIPEVKVNRLLLGNTEVIGAGWGAYVMGKPDINREIGAAIERMIDDGFVRPDRRRALFARARRRRAARDRRAPRDRQGRARGQARLNALSAARGGAAATSATCARAATALPAFEQFAPGARRRRLGRLEEVDEHFDEALRLVELREVPRVGEQLQAAARERVRVSRVRARPG